MSELLRQKYGVATGLSGGGDGALVVRRAALARQKILGISLNAKKASGKFLGHAAYTLAKGRLSRILSAKVFHSL